MNKSNHSSTDETTFFSPKEKALLELFWKETANNEAIAQQLNIDQKTVEAQFNKMYKKAGLATHGSTVHKRLALVKWAIQKNILKL